MNPMLHDIASTNVWLALWPEISLGALALLLLVLELVLPAAQHAAIPRLAFLGQIFLLGALLVWLGFEGVEPGSDISQSFFDGAILMTPLSQAGRALILLASVCVSGLAMKYFQRQTMPRVEFYHLVLVVTAAMMLLVQSAQFVLLFVALETVTVGFYVLVAYCRASPLSLEAGLKYLILGALSSAILLFGIVLLYGAAGNPEFWSLYQLGNSNPATWAANPPVIVTPDVMNYANLRFYILNNPDEPLVLIGTALVLCGVAFKIAAVPFQIWVPDVYQGAPTPTTAFLAVASKTAGFFVLLNLVDPSNGPFATPELLDNLVIPLLSALAALTILFGNLAALTQRNVKRLMGLSGISHAGYLLVGVVAAASGVWFAAGAVVFYLFTYLLGAMTVFGVMAHVAGPRDDDQDLAHYADLGRKQPFLGGVLAVGLGSLAGIPPLAGFIGKLLIFIAAFQAKLYALLGVAIVGVVISIYYYFGWMREALFRADGAPVQAPGAEEGLSPTLAGRVALALLAGATLVAGLYQGFLPGQ